jgi:hypothetical protein
MYQSVQEIPYHPYTHNITANTNTNMNTKSNTHRSLAEPTASLMSGPVIQPIYATFGPESIFVTCPYCHHTDSTEIQQAIGSEALLWACIIPGFGLLRKSKWDTRHRCKNCLNVIGIYYPQ